MRISKIAVVIGILCVATPAISAFADGVPVATAPVALNPAAPNPAMRAALKAKLQELRADIQAVSARQCKIVTRAQRGRQWPD